MKPFFLYMATEELPHGKTRLTKCGYVVDNPNKDGYFHVSNKQNTFYSTFW